MLNRSAGILLHLSSLPSPYGIGDCGSSAERFVDFSRQAGQRYWQLLPLTPVEGIYGNSPYSSRSAFAFNPLFISPERLQKAGWITPKDFPPLKDVDDEVVRYSAVGAIKDVLFSAGYRWLKQGHSQVGEFQRFCKDQSAWLDDFALFNVIKDAMQGKIWTEWPVAFRDRDSKTLRDFAAEHRESLEKIKLIQFLAFDQWRQLKSYGNSQGIEFIGDMPIYVNDDSADVWANPHLFRLNADRRPKFVAGVPPDYFSVTGQRWGNPVYDWPVMKKDGFSWWLKRLRHNLQLFDIVRIDHFRGLIGYWEIPAEEPTAVNGHWEPGPGNDFFHAIKKEFGQIPIIAEDLGIITPDVTATMERFKIPGMKVLLFAFGGDLKTHIYLPEQYTEDCLVYTGTHDNNTVIGWWKKDATPHEKKNVAEYLKTAVDPKKLPWQLTELAYRSKAAVAIIPMQDLLSLGTEARMNVPATSSGNWQWRMRKEHLSADLAARLSALTRESRRRSPVAAPVSFS